MTLQIDTKTFLLHINEPNDLVRLTDHANGGSKAMSLEDFAKLIRLGIRANVSELP